ncbi:MAG: ArsR family transcriptional regulator [Deltaproteobacteria bacterium]|nr:ArsR family transcriptional regulator [Deltaproteobacteria bacterium]
MEDEEWDERIAMKKKVVEFHAEFCKTFSSPKRLEILCLLKEGELTVSDITKKLGLSKASVSQHLTLMRMMGILKARRDGVNTYYMLANKRLAKACNLMQDALEQLMEGSVRLNKDELVAIKGDLTR